MGWSDISISLSGPIVQSLQIHFSDRWLAATPQMLLETPLTTDRNYIFSQKYKEKDEEKYRIIEAPLSHAAPSDGLFGGDASRVFGGLHEHFGRHMRRFMGGGDDELDGDNQPDHGMHIQLTRRCALLFYFAIGTEVANIFKLHGVVRRASD
jgi:phospholipase D1/2